MTRPDIEGALARWDYSLPDKCSSCGRPQPEHRPSSSSEIARYALDLERQLAESTAAEVRMREHGIKIGKEIARLCEALENVTLAESPRDMFDIASEALRDGGGGA